MYFENFACQPLYPLHRIERRTCPPWQFFHFSQNYIRANFRICNLTQSLVLRRFYRFLRKLQKLSLPYMIAETWTAWMAESCPVHFTNTSWQKSHVMCRSCRDIHDSHPVTPWPRQVCLFWIWCLLFTLTRAWKQGIENRNHFFVFILFCKISVVVCLL